MLDRVYWLAKASDQGTSGLQPEDEQVTLEIDHRSLTEPVDVDAHGFHAQKPSETDVAPSKSFHSC